MKKLGWNQTHKQTEAIKNYKAGNKWMAVARAVESVNKIKKWQIKIEKAG